MTKKSRASRIVLGCGLGCGGALVLLFGGCFAFQAWLESPGELLAPTAMLDPHASAHVAMRFDLADPPTRELVDGLLAAAQRSGHQLNRGTSSPLMDFFVRWNEDRQRRDLERLFPITAAWVAWPGQSEAERVGAIVVSARGMSHQVVFTDWVLGLVGDRMKGLPTHRIAGERVYEIPIEPGEPLYAFLDPAGVIVCLDLASVAPAAERLRQHRAAPAAASAPTDLERRLAGVPESLPLRGVVLDRQGEIAQLLAWLAPAADSSDWEPAWEPLTAATVAGRFAGGNGIALTLELTVDPATDSTRRALLIADLERYFVEPRGAGKATVRPSVQGATLDLLFEDLPRRVEEM